MGYLPEALRNFLQLLGYPVAEGESEVQSYEEFIANFEFSRVNTVGPVFDVDKLNWLNGHYIRSLDETELGDRLVAHIREFQRPDLSDEHAALVRRAVPLVRERLVLLGDALPWLGSLLVSDADLVIADDARAQLGPDSAVVLEAALVALGSLDTWETASIEAALRTSLLDEAGLKPKVAFTPLRVAIAGQRVSPPLFESMELLGRDSVVARVGSLRATL